MLFLEAAPLHTQDVLLTQGQTMLPSPRVPLPWRFPDQCLTGFGYTSIHGETLRDPQTLVQSTLCSKEFNLDLRSLVLPVCPLGGGTRPWECLA